MGWRRKQTQQKRKEYTGPRAVDSTCRNGGSCPYCRNNRLHQTKKVLSGANDDIEHDFFYCECGQELDSTYFEELMK